MYVCMYVFVYSVNSTIRVLKCVYVATSIMGTSEVYVCMYVCMYVCTYVCMYVHVFVMDVNVFL